MATPILDAIRRCGSRVEFSATTENVTSPGYKYFRPSLREINLQLGGKMEETRTRFCAAMPASRSANSKEVSRALCLPTHLVRKIRLGTSSLPKLMSSGGARFWNESQNVAHGEGFVIQELFRSENNLPRLAPDICRCANVGFLSASNYRENLFRCRCRFHFHGIAADHAGHNCLLARQTHQVISVAFQLVDLLIHYQTVGGTFFDAGACALRRATLHHVSGAAHDVGDRAGQSLRFTRIGSQRQRRT